MMKRDQTVELDFVLNIMEYQKLSFEEGSSCDKRWISNESTYLSVLLAAMRCITIEDPRNHRLHSWITASKLHLLVCANNSFGMKEECSGKIESFWLGSPDWWCARVALAQPKLHHTASPLRSQTKRFFSYA